MAKTKRFSFEKWIVKFRKENSDRGVIARIVFSDGAFPTLANETAIKQYLKNNGATDHVLEILDNLFLELERDTLFQNAKSSQVITP